MAWSFNKIMRLMLVMLTLLMRLISGWCEQCITAGANISLMIFDCTYVVVKILCVNAKTGLRVKTSPAAGKESA